MALLGEAVMIMTIGMGGVFIFLAIQAFITDLLCRLAPADAPTESEEAPAHHTGDGALQVAVIQAAVTAYETDQGARQS